MSTTRIYLVDDEPVVLRGLQLLLDQRPGMEIVGFAGSVASALDQAPPLYPDVIVLDLTLRDGDGFRLISEFRVSCPRARLLVFSMHAERAFIEAAMQAGADDYVIKEEGTEKLLQVLEQLIGRQPVHSEDMPPAPPLRGIDPGLLPPRASKP